jgi:hypothetical protein
MSMKAIAIVAGGDSSEYGISLKSAAGLYSFIDKTNYNTCIVILRGRDWSACPEGIDSPLRIPMDKNDFSYTYQGQKKSLRSGLDYHPRYTGRKRTFAGLFRYDRSALQLLRSFARCPYFQ